MVTLTIRNVDPELQSRLRVRAAHNGRSMEAELRQILREAVGPDKQGRKENLAEIARRIFGPLGGVDLEPHPPAPIGLPPEFDK